MNVEDDVFIALITALAALICVSYANSNQLRRQTRRWWVRPINRARNLKGFHLNLFRELKQTDHEEFFVYTRMWPHQFEDLLRRVHPLLPKGGPRPPLPSELKLAVTLAFLAHGDSARSKAWEFRIGRSTVYVVVRQVCRAIWLALQEEFLPPPSEERWREVARGFFTKWQFPNCIGALDGKHIKIKAPPRSGSRYYCYKHFFSIVLMAICDADYKFIWVDIGQYGSVSDGGVWANTDLAASLETEDIGLPPPAELPHTIVKTHHAFVADEAFPLGMHMLRPYSRKNLTDNQRIFNYRLSRARRTIENAFGIMAARWQILLKGIFFHPKNVDEIVKAIVCLHNFIMDGEIEQAPHHRRYCAPGLADSENSRFELMEGLWRGAVDRSPLFENLRRLSRNHGTGLAKVQRDVVCEYLVSPAGFEQVPWQAEVVFRGREINQPGV